MIKLSTPSFFYSILRSIIPISIILVSIFIIYQNDLRVVFEKATSFSSGNIANFILVIPLLMGYVIYRNRQKLKLSIHKNTKIITIDVIMGIVLVVVSLTIFTYGSETFYILEYHILSMIVFGIGSTILLFNITTFKKTSFAFVLTLFLIPIPAEFVTIMVSDISPINTVLIHSTLETFGIDIVSDFISGYPTITAQNQLGDQFTWHIGETSSGLYSMLTLSSLGLFLAYIVQGKIWKRMIIFVIGFPILFVLNIVRISTMISLWYYFDETVSESFHMISGSVMIAVCTFVLLIIGTKILKLNLLRTIPNFESSKDYESKTPISKNYEIDGSFTRLNLGYFIKMGIFLLIITIGITITLTPNISANNLGDDLLQNNNVTRTVDLKSTNEQELIQLLPQIENWELEYLYRDMEFEKDADMHLALWLKYISDDKLFSDTEYDPVLFGGVEIWDFAHRWESSLVWPGRPAAALFEQKDIQISEDVMGRLVVYQMPNTEKTDAVLYWIKEIPYINNYSTEKKYVHLVVWSNTDYLTSIGVIDKVDDVESIEELFLRLAIPMETYWNQQNIIMNNNLEDSLQLSVLKSMQKQEKSKNAMQQMLTHDIVTPHINDGLKNFIKKNDTASLISQANSLSEDYNFIQAIKIYDKIIQDDSQNIPAIVGKANALLTMRNISDAITQYDVALNLDPKNINANNGKANAFNVDKRFYDAINQYEKTLDIDPDNINAIRGIVISFEKLNKQNNALLFLNNLSHQNTEIKNIEDKLIERINQMNSNNENDLTIEQKYQNAEDVFSSGDYDTALQMYEHILKIDPNYANAIGGQAAVYHRTEQLEKAMKYYDEAIQLEPNNLFFLGDRANLLALLGSTDEAIEELESILEISPFHKTALNSLANIYSQFEDYKKELHYREQVLRVEFNNVDALVGKANALVGLEKYEDAIAYYDKTLDIDSANLNAINGKANTYVKLCKIDHSLKLYNEVLDIDPDNKNSKNGIRAAKNIETECAIK